MGKRYYDNYDYEEAYKEQCKKLEEAEMERWMKEGWVNCLYRTSTYKSTNTETVSYTHLTLPTNREV